MMAISKFKTKKEKSICDIIDFINENKDNFSRLVIMYEINEDISFGWSETSYIDIIAFCEILKSILISEMDSD